MKVLLIDADQTRHDLRLVRKGLKRFFPNLALMKISAYWKFHGHEVGFNITDPDMVYISCVFTWNRYKVAAATMYPKAQINIGGSGIDLNKELPVAIDEMPPDYSLYGITNTSYGFTSRGCIRNCHFCIVHAKEGQFSRSDRHR